MNTVRAYYDGSAFVPIESCKLKKGTVVYLTIGNEAILDENTTQRLTEFERINNNLKQLDKYEPLLSNFDDILTNRAHFSGGIDL